MYTQIVKMNKRNFIYKVSNPNNDLSYTLYNYDVKIDDIVSFAGMDYVLLVLSCKSQDDLENVISEIGGEV